jgi:hypothetical protein
MNILDDTSNNEVDKTTQPGSLNFVPADPEVPIASIASVAETAPAEAAVEKKEIGQENEPIYEAPIINKPAQTPMINIPQAPTPVAAPVVVDKSNELTKTHHLQNSHDKLTALADTDEEKFIEEVEAAHGHK